MKRERKRKNGKDEVMVEKEYRRVMTITPFDKCLLLNQWRLQTSTLSHCSLLNP